MYNQIVSYKSFMWIKWQGNEYDTRFVERCIWTSKVSPSAYEAKKIINKLGLKYIKIDAYPKDCMLYLGDEKNLETCKTCGTSRWKPKKKR